jgi:hypothetical protein
MATAHHGDPRGVVPGRLLRDKALHNQINIGLEELHHVPVIARLSQRSRRYY